MTLLELQMWLGKHMEKLNDETLTEKEKKEEFERSDFVAKIAKQMVNNADVILRADALYNRDNLQNSNIMRIIVNADEESNK